MNYFRRKLYSLTIAQIVKPMIPTPPLTETGIGKNELTMRTKITFLCLLAFLSFFPQARAQCLPPTNPAVSNITSNSFRLAWTAPASAPGSGYDIYIATANTAPGATTTPTLTSDTAGADVINGLTPGLTYYYWIRSNCGTQKSTWVSGGSFTANQSLTCNGAIYGLYPNATFTPACSGSAETIAADSWAGEYSNVNVSANKQYTFSSSVSTDYITITNTAGTAVLASGQSPLSWSSGTLTGVVRYHLNSNANCGTQNSSRIRYVQCSAATSACGLPTALNVTNITSNSSRLNWTAPATPAVSYDIYVVTSNTAPVAGTTPTATSTNAGVGVLSGLTAATTYYYWIRSNCIGSNSNWVSGGSFTTLASLNCNGAAHGLYPEATFTPACSGSQETIVTDAYAGEYSNVNVVANRQYTFSSSVATDYITITNATGTVVYASGQAPLNWVSGTTTGVIRYHLNTNSACGTQTTARARYIKCSSVTATCSVPSNFVVSNYTSNSVRLSWTQPATLPSAGYGVYVSTTNTAPTASTNPTTSANGNYIPYLNGLSAGTTYYFWVRSDCGSSTSAWVSGGSFTTLTALACNSATYGLAPEATFTPACTGTAEIITDNAFAGQFTNVIALDNKQYTFSTSVSTDYITVTNGDGGVVYASGQSPLVWVSGSTSGTIRYYIHANANCGAQNTSRVRYITCANAPAATCNAPTNLSVVQADMMTYAAHLQWTAPNPAPSGYLVYYNTVNQLGGTMLQTLSTSEWIDGLSPGTTYYWWVSSNCNQTFVPGGSFTTLQEPVNTACFAQIAAGPHNSLAIKTDGTLWGWGNNFSGQLGLGTINTNQATPAQIGNGNDWKMVAPGLNHTMAIKNNGTLWAMGNNGNGRLGTGGSTGTLISTPVQVGTASNWKSVAAGQTHTIAVKTDGTLWAWGQNNYGQLGDNTTVDKTTPVQIGTATNWQNVYAGRSSSYAVKADGTLWSWGLNSDGQLGIGSTTNKSIPTVTNMTNVQYFAAGGLHAMAIKTNGTLWVWGNNQQGQLGDGTTTNRNAPVQIGQDDVWKAVAGGDYHSIGINTNGSLYTWGQNNFGQLGDNTTINKTTPFIINDNAVAIAGGNFHSMVLHGGGYLAVTGGNASGQLGNPQYPQSDEFFMLDCPTTALGNEEFEPATAMKLYPNPVTNLLNIALENEITSVTVYNMLGQEVISKSVNTNQTTIDVENLQSGTYLVKVVSGGQTKTSKIIKK